MSKIQGDGRKFLDHFIKVILGHKYEISVFITLIKSGPYDHIYRLQPESTAKGEFFSVFFLI